MELRGSIHLDRHQDSIQVMGLLEFLQSKKKSMIYHKSLLKWEIGNILSLLVDFLKNYNDDG